MNGIGRAAPIEFTPSLVAKGTLAAVRRAAEQRAASGLPAREPFTRYAVRPYDPCRTHRELASSPTPAADASLKEVGVSGLHRIVRAALFVAAAAALTYAAVQLREKHQKVSSTVDDIEGQVMALDPVTRAAVLARLGADSAKVVHDRVSD